MIDSFRLLSICWSTAIDLLLNNYRFYRFFSFWAIGLNRYLTAIDHRYTSTHSIQVDENRSQLTSHLSQTQSHRPRDIKRVEPSVGSPHVYLFTEDSNGEERQ